VLLLRVFREDILGCSCCGRRKVIAFIDEKPVIERMLGHLGLPTVPARLPALAEAPLWQTSSGDSGGRCLRAVSR